MNSIRALKALSVVTNVDTGHMIKELQVENEKLKKVIRDLNIQALINSDFEDHLWMRYRMCDSYMSTLGEIELENWDIFQNNFFEAMHEMDSSSGDDSTGEYELNYTLTP